MKVQSLTLASGKESWMVLDANYVPVKPIERYIRYLESLERSPYTIKNKAHHLKLFWEFLRDYRLTWDAIDATHIAEFIYWLRSPEASVVSIHQQEDKRCESTINVIRSAVTTFYEYHSMQGDVKEIPLFKYIRQPRKFKDFLYHINQSKPVKNSLFKIKEPKKIPQILTREEAIELIEACRSIRDKFLVQLLYESGMRIGQALGLRHEDISTWDNEIKVIPRFNNANKVRAKSNRPNALTVSPELMQLYTDYLVDELDDIVSDYVFVTLKNKAGKPLTYNAAMSVFRSLRKRTGIDFVTPHKFRHTHATELIRDDMGMEWVQKRLGHQSVQTTIDIYSHLEVEDLRPHLETFFERNKDN